VSSRTARATERNPVSKNSKNKTNKTTTTTTKTHKKPNNTKPKKTKQTKKTNQKPKAKKKKKTNEFMKFSDKWMDLEDIILSEVTQSQKNSHDMYSLISEYLPRNLEYPR
jgi:negative regulator of genetic competence, sporulation and motility